MKTYSFLDVRVGFAGPTGVFSLSKGGVADEGITFAPDGNINTKTMAADGDGMHTLHANRSGTVTIRLLKSSPLNGQLMTALNLQRTSAALWGQNIITLVDPNKGDNVTAEQCAFEKWPNLAFGTEAQPVEWAFSAIIINLDLG